MPSRPSQYRGRRQREAAHARPLCRVPGGRDRTTRDRRVSLHEILTKTPVRSAAVATPPSGRHGGYSWSYAPPSRGRRVGRRVRFSGRSSAAGAPRPRPCFSMSFLNPLMLLGVGAAVLPLVLHLLSRSRYRTIDWGGMLFLTMPGDVRQRRGMLGSTAGCCSRGWRSSRRWRSRLARPVLRGRFGAGRAGAIGGGGRAGLLGEHGVRGERRPAWTSPAARPAGARGARAGRLGRPRARRRADPAPGRPGAPPSQPVRRMPLTNDLQAVADPRRAGPRRRRAGRLRRLDPRAIELLRRRPRRAPTST